MIPSRAEIYRLADTIGAIPTSGPVLERARARSLVLWSILSVPLGAMCVLFSQGFDLTRPASLGVLIGSTGMLASIWHLRRSQQIDKASLLFLTSVFVALGAAPLFEPYPSLPPLILLVVTPVLFGLIVDWKLCLSYTLGLTIYFTILFILHQVYGAGGAIHGPILLACASSAFAAGLSTVAYSHATARTAGILKKQRNELAAWANVDPLTGVMNRRAFNQDVQDLLEEKKTAQIAIIDLDNFKQLNDRYGHDTGDAILVEASRRISTALPEFAEVYRMGGDEFAILFKDPQGQASELLCAIAKTAREKISTKIGDIPIQFSMGLSRTARGQIDIHQLYQEADIALFEAKQESKTSWRMFDTALDQQRLRRSALVRQLKKALGKHLLTVVFQPQYDIAHNQVIGFEALARWKDEIFGDVSPAEFISIAEEESLVQELDRAIFASAIRQSETWLDRTQKIAINISGKTLLSPNFDSFVQRTIARSRLSADQVQIEITETELLKNTVSAKHIARRLSDLGVSIALDDFGTGYSSLSYLSELPIHRLKVDKSFIQASDLGSNLTILRTIISLAASLDLDLIIEGIEKQNHLVLVKDLGCMKVQGFYFSRPLTAEQCIDLTANRPPNQVELDNSAA